MTAEKTSQGAWRISAVINGYRISRTYFFYTKKEALAEFRAEFKQNKKD